MKWFVHVAGRDFELEVEPAGDGARVRHQGRELFVRLDRPAPGVRAAALGDRRVQLGWWLQGGVHAILREGESFSVVVRDALTERVAREGSTGPCLSGPAEVRAPIPGLITRVLRQAGESVSKDEPVLRLDAMKLENEIAAPRDGVLRAVDVSPGQPVQKGQRLFVVGPAGS